jgi:molecular chaperone DnaK (HSP70)
MDGRRRRELRDALLQAGINIVQFVHEPLAALYAHFRAPELGSKTYGDLIDELALVFDWGGGTLDLTLCYLGAESVSQVANFGDNEVGGDYIDEALMRYVLEKVADQKLKDTNREAPGVRANLLEQCEQAKIRLSKADSALIFVPDFFLDAEDNDVEFVLTREEYDLISAIYVSRGIAAIDQLLERLNIDRRRISLCLATGGMINTPSIHSALLQLFGADRLYISNRGDRVISEGCAWIAHDVARLKLAKPLEVVEARETYLAIFKENDALPLLGEAITQNLSMYCVDPRDGIAKIKLARPRNLGKSAATDPRDVYGCLSVRVEVGAAPFRERLQVKFLVDHDLIVRVEAESMLLHDEDSIEILDLEFSLDSSKLLLGDNMFEDKPKQTSATTGVSVDKGGVVLRSNVTTKKNFLKLVPGELLYQTHRKLFDRRNPDPLPKLLHDEKHFYSPCSICGRRYNHPECKCAQDLAY